MTDQQVSAATGSACLFLCLMLASCAPTEGPPVRFIVPDGFRGPFTIFEEKGADEVVIEHGEYVYRIPTSGVLRVAGAKGFSEWHEVYAFFASGRPLPVKLTRDPEWVSGEVALYELASSQTRLRFFIGTQAEMEVYVREPVFETEAARILARPPSTNDPREAPAN